MVQIRVSFQIFQQICPENADVGLTASVDKGRGVDIVILVESSDLILLLGDIIRYELVFFETLKHLRGAEFHRVGVNID